MRLLHTAALACALLGLAPAAQAQTSGPPLLPTVGDPVPYSIGLPKGWEIHREEDGLIAVSDDVMVFVSAADMMKDEKLGLPVSEAEARRILTNMFMGSDSLLLGLMSESFNKVGSDGELSDVVQEIQSLGGQRAAVMRGRYTEDGESGKFEMRITIKDGIMYMVGFVVQGDGYAAQEPLFGRIRDSLVLATAP